MLLVMASLRNGENGRIRGMSDCDECQWANDQRKAVPEVGLHGDLGMEPVISKIGIRGPGEIKQAMEQSMHGFLAVLLAEKAFRTDIVVFVICVCIVSVLPQLTWCERALLIYAAFMPLVAELMNTAIERTIDRISTEYHELSKLAKDIGSALVFFAFLGGWICWFVILLGWAVRFWGT